MYDPSYESYIITIGTIQYNHLEPPQLMVCILKHLSAIIITKPYSARDQSQSLLSNP
jgi:hypothetical protein